jgi:predicted transposase YdaD
MCNLSQGVYDRGKAEGMNIGWNKGKEEAQIDILKRLLKDSVTLDKALEIVDIDVETYKKYLNENIK